MLWRSVSRFCSVAKQADKREKGPVVKTGPPWTTERGLEVNTDTELDGARVVRLIGDLAEGGRGGQCETRVRRLVVVRDVSEGEEQLGAYLFLVDANVLHHLR